MVKNDEKNPKDFECLGNILKSTKKKFFSD